MKRRVCFALGGCMQLINAVNEAGRLVAEARLFSGADMGGELGSGLAGAARPLLPAPLRVAWRHRPRC